MEFFLMAIVVLVLGGTAALACAGHAKWANRFGVTSAIAGCILGLIPAVKALYTTEPILWQTAWTMPYSSFSLKIDALAGFFLLVMFGLSLLGALYGSEYLQPAPARKLGLHWFSFDLLIASMAIVITAANAILFIEAWEIMTISSFFLVIFESEQAEVRKAGWLYLVASHIGAIFLLLVFFLLGHYAGDSLEFAAFAQIRDLAPAVAGAIFVFSVIGFGTKAGFMPLHVWLPDAHPAAPSHVSALMSGVMIKTGIYGILRILTFLGTPPQWWGILLAMVGVVSGVLGVWFALAQHDLKRLLAYHSVENIGIIAMGLGIGLLGVSYNMPTVAVLGFAGGLLHVLNHAAFKGLLFLGAGAVLHATHTRDLDQLGGLLKKMPATGVNFLIGAVAICGLPPLNGFVSEFLIYWASFCGSKRFTDARVIVALAVIVGLALIGGLAIACFTKAFAVVFLGQARSTHCNHAHDPGFAMQLPMYVLTLVCCLVGVVMIFAGFPLLGRSIQIVSGLPMVAIETELGVAVESLSGFMVMSIAMVVGIGLVMLWRKYALASRQVGATATWGCGYLAPTSHMQYTASSYAQHLVDLNAHLLLSHKEVEAPQGYFPKQAHFASHSADSATEKLYRPVFMSIEWLFRKLIWLQHGYLHWYLVYVFIVLLFLFTLYAGLN